MEETRLGHIEVSPTAIASLASQIFEIGSFHSDPHQGNLFAMADGRVGFVDFGRVSSISDRDRESC